MAMELGLQLFTVRNELRKNFERGLQAIADIGYRNVEFAMFDPEALAGEPPLEHFEAPALRKLLDSFGMHAISLNLALPIQFDELTSQDFDWHGAAAYSAALGCTGLVYSMMFYHSQDEVLRFAEYLNNASRICKEEGVRLIYHNHFQEFQKFGGRPVLDILLDHTEEDVKLELDTFWALRGGVDPAGYLRKIGSRCVLIHQKDLAKACTHVDLVGGYTGFIGLEQFSQAKPEEFIEVGEGAMDIQGILETCRELKSVRYCIIEQDYSKLPPMESAMRSFENMKRFF